MSYQTAPYWDTPEEERRRLLLKNPVFDGSEAGLYQPASRGDPASVRYNNPGAQYPGKSASTYGSTGYGVIGGGHKIAQFPDAESGASAHFDLLNRGYTGRSVKDAIAKWSGGNSPDAYVNHIYNQTGISPDTVITPEFLRDPKTGIPFARAMAQWEAGKPYPMTDAQWATAHSRAFGPTSPNEGLDGAPKPTPTPQVASFAQRSPKPMAEEGGFFSNLMDWANTPIGEARRKTQPIRDRYADGDGNLNFTTEEFLAKYPGLNKPGIREQIPAMLDVYRMGRDLNSAAINERSTPQAATWGQGLGEALKLAGSVATARNSPQLGMQMAQGIGADWRANNDMRQKLALSSALQQAQALTAGSDAAIKDSMARIEAKRNKNAIFRSANMPIPHPEVEGGEGATAVPSGTTGVGGVSASPIPVERGTLPDVGAQTQAVPQTTEGAGRFSAPVAQPQARAPIQSNAATGQSGDDLLRKSMAFSADKSTEELGKNFMEQYKLQQGSPTGQAAERAKVAESLGMKPGDQAYQSYVATGKMPREDQAMLTATDKKAIMEAEELALAGNESIRALKEAASIGTVQKDPKTGKEVRPDINTGYTASLRAGLADKMPDLLVPDWISSKTSAQNTINYDNLVLGQALGTLKATFGAAPTEGERKILLELQASSGMSPEARKPILERAIGLAERRMQFHNDRANQLRGGDFYKPKDGSKSDYKNVPRTSAPGGEGNRTSAEDPLGIR